MTRQLKLLEVPTGRAVLDLLPTLARVLSGQGPALLPVPAGDEVETGRLATALGAGLPLTDVEDDEADPTALVIATSGSTGTPKGALLPTGALRASASATSTRLAAGGAANWLLALPAHHIAGLQVLLRSVAQGTEPAVLDVARSFQPAEFVAAVGTMPSGPRLTSLVPTQLHRLLHNAEASAALATFDAVLVGGAASSPRLLADAQAAGASIVTTYGMSETCGGCVYDGLALDGVLVELEGPARQVTIRGTVVARGYRGRPGHAAFGPNTFRTSDLGLVDTAGRLLIMGRVDDVIITGGIKIDPVVVESALGGVPGVGEVVVVGVPDAEWGQALVAVVVPGPGSQEPDLTALRLEAVRAAGDAAAPRYLLLTGQLPLRGPGKPDRSAIAELAAQGLAGASVLPGRPPDQMAGRPTADEQMARPPATDQ